MFQDARQRGCTIRRLPSRSRVQAASTATRVNPLNAPRNPGTLPPQHIALVTSVYWGPEPRRITVSFLEATRPDLRARILSHMNAWSRSCSISFVETARGGQVRISRVGGGYWSYLGTDVLHIPRNRPTMNLEAFSMRTPESEFVRVVRHETGHTLGFPHEHMRRELVALIDPAKAYRYFARDQGWDRQTVDEQVLTPLDQRSIMATPADQTSIMCYQLPGSITRNGRPITGGDDINASDYAFAGRIYPKVAAATVDFDPDQEEELIDLASHWPDDWDEAEDVREIDLTC